MGIDVTWQDERGDAIKAVLDPHGRLPRLLGSADLRDTVCLRFIDPYGDATFNQRQIPTLVEELHRVLRQVTDADAQEHLRQVLALVEESVGTVHTYVEFLGD